MSQTTARFDLQTRLAVGNAGLVYRGVDKATRRRVALKLLIDTGLPHPLDGEALLRDAARVGRTAGNNIVQLLEVIPDEEVGMVLVYEYADGLNWTDAAKERRLDAAQAVDIAAQFLSALAVGEAIRVPHGELKPMNLVLGELPGGRLFVWVLDWGLAAYRPAPPDDALPWMSPERLAGAPASAEADLFAMGACLCWLLTGTVPVAGETREQLAAGWRKFPPNALAQVRPDLPAKFTRWVGTLLEANPRSRFATAAQARQALAALDPPSPPILPEIFRPRPKSPYSSVAPARSGIVPRAVPGPRVVAVPVALQPEVESASEILEDAAPAGETEEIADEVAEVAGEESAEASEAGEETGEPFPPTAPETDEERETEPSAESPTEEDLPVEAEAELANDPLLRLAAPDPVPLTASGRQGFGLGLAILVLLAVIAAAWHFIPRRSGDAGVGGGTATGGPPEVVLQRDLGPRAAFCPNGKGGTWWYGFKLTHFPPPGQPGVYELQANLFSETAIDDGLRLTFTESKGVLSLVSFPAGRSATLPGPANQPQQILVKVAATAAGPGLFNLALELWANPNPAQLGPPAFTASASKVALPPRLGVRFQKSPSTVPTTTRVAPLRFGPNPQEALK